MTRLIDAHVHLWDRERFDYPWLDEELDLPAVFLPRDLSAPSASANAFVFVQADTIPAQGLAEASWVQSLAADVPELAGIVAFAALEDADCDKVLDALGALPRMVGVRRLLQDEDDDFFTRPALTRGLDAVAQRDWTFDACVRSHQLDALAALLRGCDELTVVLDHLGKPPLAAGPREFQEWLRGIRAIAELPRTAVKLSGLPAEASRSAGGVDYGPWLRAALDAFGPQRCMIGSDWPVSAREGETRADWFETVRQETRVDEGEWAELSERTATRVYGLSGPALRP